MQKNTLIVLRYVLYIFISTIAATGFQYTEGMIGSICEDDKSCSMIEGGYCSKLYHYHRCDCLDGYVKKNNYMCIKSSKLGEMCQLDKQCQILDRNSHCISAYEQQLHLVYRCSCRKNFRSEIINGTEKCIRTKSYDDSDVDELTAAPIIICFISCIFIEILCLLGFRYWKKYRMQSEFRGQEINLQVQGRCNQLFSSRPTPIPIVTFSILHPPNPVLSGTGPASPPSYPIQVTFNQPTSITTTEEDPPSYDDAIKLSLATPSVSDPQTSQTNNVEPREPRK